MQTNRFNKGRTLETSALHPILQRKRNVSTFTKGTTHVFLFTYFVVLAYKMLFSSYFQQNLLILSKIENPRWRPSGILFVTMATAAN